MFLAHYLDSSKTMKALKSMLIKFDSLTALKLEAIHHIYSVMRLVKTELILKTL